MFRCLVNWQAKQYGVAGGGASLNRRKNTSSLSRSALFKTGDGAQTGATLRISVPASPQRRTCATRQKAPEGVTQASGGAMAAMYNYLPWRGEYVGWHMARWRRRRSGANNILGGGPLGDERSGEPAPLNASSRLTAPLQTRTRRQRKK